MANAIVPIVPILPRWHDDPRETRDELPSFWKVLSGVGFRPGYFERLSVDELKALGADRHETVRNLTVE